MKKASNQKELGDSLYIFESKGGSSTECLILGHAGWVESLGSVFTLPAGVSLLFRSHHTEPNVTSPLAELHRDDHFQTATSRALTKQSKAATMLLDDQDKRDFAPGSVCKNYVVVKGLGYHWDKAKADRWSYEQIENYMSAAMWKPHVVSVRNRKAIGKQKFLLLADIIALVRKQYPGVTKFIFGGCRGVHPDWKP
jgi:hypothetical protein